MKSISSILLASMLLLCPSCGPRQCTDNSTEMTLGIAQRSIMAGMSQADVAIVMGSPNIVSKDRENKETWIYDKIASEVKQSSTGVGLVLAGGAGCVGGGGGFGTNSSQRTSTQKTLTIVIKFDENQTVESINYHSSKF